MWPEKLHVWGRSRLDFYYFSKLRGVQDRATHRIEITRNTNYSRRHKLTNQPTNQLVKSSTKNLKLLPIILQQHSNFRSVLAKILVKKQVKTYYLHPIMPCGLSIFKPRTCILHHFAFLVWFPTHDFWTAIIHFLPLKPYFLIVFYPFQPCVSWLLKVLFIQLLWMFMLFISHFAALYHAFSTKMQCI